TNGIKSLKLAKAVISSEVKRECRVLDIFEGEAYGVIRRAVIDCNGFLTAKTYVSTSNAP
ncbi:Hypothetical predicted protein, partial [Olea europaea subsp. europaea]